MANLFDFHLCPEPVEHMAVLLTSVKCAPGRAAACSLPPLWSGERLLQELQPESEGSHLPACALPLAPGEGEARRSPVPSLGTASLWCGRSAGDPVSTQGRAWDRRQVLLRTWVRIVKKKQVQVTDCCLGFVQVS